MPTALDAIVADLKRMRPPGTDRPPARLRQEPASVARAAGRPQRRLPSCRGMPVSGLPVRRARWRPSLALRRRADRGPDGPRICLAACSKGLNGATVEEVLQVPADLVDRCGLGEILGMLRVRGLSGVLRRLKAEVTRAAIARADRADNATTARFRLICACPSPSLRHRLRATSRTLEACHHLSRLRLAASCPPGARNWSRSMAGPIAVFNVDGTFYAIDDVCTHDGGPLAEGELIGCEIMCPRHGARFDVRTGPGPLHAGGRAGGRPRDRGPRRRCLRGDR